MRAPEEERLGQISLGDSCTGSHMSLTYLAHPEGHMGRSVAEAEVILSKEIYIYKKAAAKSATFCEVLEGNSLEINRSQLALLVTVVRLVRAISFKYISNMKLWDFWFLRNKPATDDI